MENKLPERKPTRMKYHDYGRPGAYFVTICTEERAEILSTIQRGTGSVVGDVALGVPPHVELTAIGKIVEKYILSTNNIPNATVDRYVIMPNHIHMIIVIRPQIVDEPYLSDDGTPRATSPTTEGVPRIIAALKRLCNKEIGYNIFQRSYYDHIIRDKEDYDTRIKYIYENPTRWYYKHPAEGDFCGTDNA